MKTNILLPIVAIVTAFSSFLFSCTKESHPIPPPVDSTSVDSSRIVDLKKGLLLYLPFNGSMADSSGNNNPSTIIGPVGLTYDEHGYANSAFGGSGNGGMLAVTNNGSIKFDSSFTVSLSVMTRNTSLQAYICMVKRADATGTSFGLGEGIPGLPLLEMGISTTPEICGQIVSPVNSVLDTSALTLQPEAWYNLVSTFDKGVIRIFSNGVLLATKVSPSKIIPICPEAQVLVGAWFDGGESIDGKIDNVRLYNRVLNTAEIASLAQHYQLSSTSIKQIINH